VYFVLVRSDAAFIESVIFYRIGTMVAVLTLSNMNMELDFYQMHVGFPVLFAALAISEYLKYFVMSNDPYVRLVNQVLQFVVWIPLVKWSE